MVIAAASTPSLQGDLPLTVATGNGAGAAVVIMPSAFGVADDLRAQMEELTADARLVVSFDPFFRDDPGVVSYGDMGRIFTRLGALDRERAYADLQAALAWTRSKAPGPLVVVGVCFGGLYAMRAAADGLVDGACTWHGTRLDAVLDRVGAVRCPLRLHFGSADPLTPPPLVEQLREALAHHGDARITVHEGATHGFTHPDAEAYDPAAERAAVASVRELAMRAVTMR